MLSQSQKKNLNQILQLKTLYLSKYDLVNRRPTLCGYCHGLAAPMFTKFQGNRYGGCSLDHLNKIQRGEKMQKKTGSYELHKWSKEQRLAFVHSLVRSYLNHAHHQAKTGESRND